jgi:hypothetical protein
MTEVHEVPLLAMTPDNVAGYGRIVTDFDATEVGIAQWPTMGSRPITHGRGGGVAEGPFEMEWRGDVLRGRNQGVGGEHILGWSRHPDEASEDKPSGPRERILVREANYHPDGGQVFVSRGGHPFVMLMAKPGDDVQPSDFVAFHSDGSLGFHVDAGVWHQAALTAADADVFDNKQGAVHACVLCDFPDEFGVYLSVPLDGAHA